MIITYIFFVIFQKFGKKKLKSLSRKLASISTSTNLHSFWILKDIVFSYLFMPKDLKLVDYLARWLIFLKFNKFKSVWFVFKLYSKTALIEGSWSVFMKSTHNYAWRRCWIRRNVARFSDFPVNNYPANSILSLKVPRRSRQRMSEVYAWNCLENIIKNSK